MDLLEVVKQAKTLVNSKAKHANYDRVVKQAKEYAAHITGEGIDDYLKRYAIRESKEMFKQRLQLTNSINPALANSLMKPFYKVSRNNNIVKKFDFKDPKLNDKINIMLDDFNGDSIDNTDGLETWLKTRFIELTFADPNAFVVLEWDAAGLKEIIKPRPFEVSSEDAYNYDYKGAELQWLFVASKIKYNKKDGDKITQTDGYKYTLYAKGFTVVHEQIDRAYLNSIGLALAANQTFETINNIDYLLSVYNTNLNYVPAFRVGYARDITTKGKTFVNPFNPAMPYFRKALKVTSELDITMTAHAFPQKMQYVQKCQGASPTEPCDNGKCPTTQDTCKACHGSGFKTVTTAQEAIYLPMPESKEDFLPLNDLLVYKNPPIDIVEFQKKYLQDLKQDTHLAVYNSNMFAVTEAQFAKTATEIDSNMEGIYDAIEPFTEKYSKVWKLIAYTCAALSGFGLERNDFDLVHTFPADPKLKTLGILLNELKSVNDSNAPSFTRDIINNDIAEVVFNGDIEALTKYRVRHNFYPFNGKSSDEISMLLSTQYVSELTKILYSNFEAIFTEIEKANPKFYELKPADQWKIVDEMVLKFKDEILQTAEPIKIDFGTGQAAAATASPGDASGADTGTGSTDGAGQSAQPGANPNNDGQQATQ